MNYLNAIGWEDLIGSDEGHYSVAVEAGRYLCNLNIVCGVEA
jgi:hypothetical protein